MTRDMDLIRALMLQIEDGERYFETLDEYTAVALGTGIETQVSDEEESRRLDHHLWLLRDSGFVTFSEVGTGWVAEHITWQGHDFLDSVRDPEVWQKAKDGASAAGGFTVELLGEIAKGLIKTHVKRATGIDL